MYFLQIYVTSTSLPRLPLPVIQLHKNIFVQTAYQTYDLFVYHLLSGTRPLITNVFSTNCHKNNIYVTSTSLPRLPLPVNH